MTTVFGLVSFTSHSQNLKTLTDGEFNLVKQIYGYDKHMPLSASVLAKEDRKECMRELIIFEGHNNQKVPAYIGIPKTGTAPYPCVILIPGAGGRKDIFWNDSDYAKGYTDWMLATELLNRGIAIITPDVQYQGQRTANNNYQDAGSSVFGNLEVYKYQDVFFQSIKDFRRTIDYLETRQDIDKSRIGVAGFSAGGIMTYILTAIDSRITACVPIVTPVNPFFEVSKSPEWVRFQMGELVSPWYYVKGLGDRPFLSVDGDNDPYSSKEEKMALINLVQSKNKAHKFYNSGHKIHPDYAVFTADWFAKNL